MMPETTQADCHQTASETNALSRNGAKASSSARRLPQSFRDAPQEPKFTMKFTGKIVYAATAREVETCCRDLLTRAPLTCGFDIEWRTTFQRGVPPRPAALLQLCFAQADPPAGSEASIAKSVSRQGGTDLTCLLLHIKHSGLPPSLRRVLAEETIRLTGIGARGDAHKLQTDCGVESHGVVELLDELSRRNMPLVLSNSLANLCDAFFGAQLQKVKSVRCSNWEALPLCPGQQQYAATDAFASLLVHWAIMGLPLLALPVRPPPLASTDAPSAPCPASPPEASREDRSLARHLSELQTGASNPNASGVVVNRKRLPPARLEVLHCFMEMKMTLDDIAEQRRVKRSTVEGYLADAILVGHEYDWLRLEMPKTVWGKVVDACRQALASESAEPCAASIKLEAACEAESGIEGILRQRGLGLKSLRDGLPEETTYGQIRLCLAHLSRLGQDGSTGGGGNASVLPQ